MVIHVCFTLILSLGETVGTLQMADMTSSPDSTLQHTTMHWA